MRGSPVSGGVRYHSCVWSGRIGLTCLPFVGSLCLWLVPVVSASLANLCTGSWLRTGESGIAQLAHRSVHCFYCSVKHYNTSAGWRVRECLAGDARQAAQGAVRCTACVRTVPVKEGGASRGGRRGGRPFVKEEIKPTGQALHCVGARLVALWRRARHALGRAANLPTSFAMCAALAGAQRGVCARQSESCERAACCARAVVCGRGADCGEV